jgi:hypothetical protein
LAFAADLLMAKSSRWQIEGASEAFFDADWQGDQLELGRRVDDQDW